ncbi:MAG TPA: C40 family peptidase [Gemmatimonadales bacterium]|nr:C40 family peptidase [Gemmatimonadales bacterium]
MFRHPRSAAATWLALAASLLPASLAAQASGFELWYGFWFPDSVATTATAAYFHPLLGPVSWGLGVTHLDDHRAAVDHTLTGGELSLQVFGRESGPYAVASTGLGIRHADGNIDALWTAGAGYQLRLFNAIKIGLEARYRAEDTRVAGFWHLDPTDRRGWEIQARLAFGIGGGGGGGRAASATSSGPPVFTVPSSTTIDDLAKDSGASDDAARVATSVVETALDAMGTPYRWGGTSDNGFDCSGLIQYAYGQHGIILPRVSRDQLRMGSVVDRAVDALRPGDLLGFAINGREITHIGMYVGNGKFVHSAAEGVKLSSLTATDPDSRWWQHRWVTARRIIQ